VVVSAVQEKTDKGQRDCCSEQADMEVGSTHVKIAMQFLDCQFQILIV
jgi:hypothetical protein